jgi:predicted 3-demethylubiquinone-9 3-methyltransferase (glyoxalase superfamily)
MAMKQIIPHFWFNHQAEEATQLYVSLFRDSKIGNMARYSESGSNASGMKKDTVMSVEFSLCGQNFGAINGGDFFKFSPAVSLTVLCETEEEINRLWASLAPGGKILMELGPYPFSKRYGFLEDKYGFSWQFNLVGQKQKIVPSLLFVGVKYGHAEEAMRFYVSLFKDGKILHSEHSAEGDIGRKGTLKYGSFSLQGQEFIAMDGAGEHAFEFTGALSLMVECESQSEVNFFWDSFLGGGQEQQCGWIVDKFGVCWQVVPTILGQLLGGPDPMKAERVMKAMLGMKKLDIEKLKQAAE